MWIALGAAVVGLLAPVVVVLLPPRAVLAVLGVNQPPKALFYATDRPHRVALTIDDGPAGIETEAILDVLREHGARATFFVIGDRVPTYERVLERIRDEGHELGNHTMHERASILVPRAELGADMAAAHDILAAYDEVRWFRPGSGFYDDDIVRLAAANGYRLAIGDVFPFDALVKSSAFHAWYVLHHVRPGSVIILHEAGARGWRAADTLRTILPRLRARGLEVVTLSGLVAPRPGS
ncbi:MAG: polysaccharide deacetylase family protein [Gammaproteobacteria bacterium]|nr:polysaccharide deacetylase family protein [Gammaproteobacteria bacterium]